MPQGGSADAKRDVKLFYRSYVHPLRNTAAFAGTAARVVRLAERWNRATAVDSHSRLARALPIQTLLTSSAGAFEPLGDLDTSSLLGGSSPRLSGSTVGEFADGSVCAAGNGGAGRGGYLIAETPRLRGLPAPVVVSVIATLLA